jgi:hypothetical protein
VDDFHRSFLLLTCPVSLIFQLFWRLQGLLQAVHSADGPPAQAY